MNVLTSESNLRKQQLDEPRPSEGKSGGVDGNARLTAATAVVLLVLLAALGVTILSIGQLVWWHVLLGMLLIPPVLLKLGSTGWRFVRYYTGSGSTCGVDRRSGRCDSWHHWSSPRR